jgi:PAS domain S-box-containing protein
MPVQLNVPAPDSILAPEESLRDELELLRRSNLELTNFIETAPIALHWVGPDGLIQWANDAELRFLGYSREDYIGRHIADVHADPQVIADILARLSAGETLKDFPARLKTKRGQIKHVLIDSSVHWDNGNFLHTQCFTRDISEQKHVEDLHRHFAAIVGSSDDAILSKDLNGVIQSWNQGAQRIFGYTAEEIIGKPVTILIPAGHQDEETNILARIRRGKRIDHYETVRQRKDGSFVDISLTVSPIKDDQGNVIGASKIARDISERKQAEGALRKVRLQLAKANEDLEARVQERTASLKEAVAQMEEFSYSASHDLRGPVRAMHGYAQVLLDDYGDRLDDRGLDYLQRIVRGGARMDKLIQDVLTYSRLARSQIQLQPVSLDILIRDIIQHYPEMQPPRACILITPPLLKVLAHEPSLTQALSNLLGNAMKFVAPGVIPAVELRTERRGAAVRLWIKDNGIGIRPEYQSRLFGMFERVIHDLRYDGTGIGLAIVRKAVEKMGGSVGLESDGIHGSSFWIELPSAD